MNTTRRALLGAALAAPAVARAQEAITLRLHHFAPAASNNHRQHLLPWAQKVAAESGNRLRIQVFPAMQLGGAPPQLFDQARDGVVDMAFLQPGFTPGRFARFEALELPFTAGRVSIPNARAVQRFFERHMLDEFREVHLIAAFGHDRGLIHATRAVRTQDDLRGLRIRFPSRLGGEALRTLGAGAVGLPVGQIPEAISQRVIDGALVPWEIVPALRLHEMVRHHTEIPGANSFYMVTFAVVMNRARHAGLPPDLRAVLDANSGAWHAAFAGRIWDENAAPSEELARRRGNEIGAISEAEAARWKEAVRPVGEAWFAQMRERGVDGPALAAEAAALFAEEAARG
jgi:TRAP-type transport system periplasmic protein